MVNELYYRENNETISRYFHFLSELRVCIDPNGFIYVTSVV